MSPLEVMFWALTLVVVVCAASLAAVIVVGVVDALRGRRRRKPVDTATQIMPRHNDDGSNQ